MSPQCLSPSTQSAFSRTRGTGAELAMLRSISGIREKCWLVARRLLKAPMRWIQGSSHDCANGISIWRRIWRPRAGGEAQLHTVRTRRMLSYSKAHILKELVLYRTRITHFRQAALIILSRSSQPSPPALMHKRASYLIIPSSTSMIRQLHGTGAAAVPSACSCMQKQTSSSAPRYRIY